MPRIILLVLFLGLVITGCSQGNVTARVEARELSAEEVSAVFGKEGLELAGVEVRPASIFQRELNGRKPLVFLLEEKELIVYQYESAQEREEGWADFETSTATADLIPYKAYQEQSLLLFYIHEEGIVNNVMDRNIKAAISALLELEES